MITATLESLDQPARDAITLLAQLLRIDTTNPPGNERPACELVAERLRTEGIEPVIVESAPGRASLVARLRASDEDRVGGPLMLSAHLDVVTAGDPSRWTHPPFQGTIDQGYVWGRGAVDMKNMAALAIEVMLGLKRRGARLTRDLILTLVADEEEGCDQGSRHLVDHHKELVAAEYALGEVGGFTLHIGRSRFYPIMVAEKGVAWLKLRARGQPGHGSMPNPDSAVVRLAKAVARLGTSRLPQHNTPVVSAFVRAIAEQQGMPTSLVLKALLNPRLSGVILKRVFPDKTLARPFLSALSNTVSPTVLAAGSKTNVIPGEASALLDGRTLPGQTTQDLIAELRAVLGHEAEGLDFEILREAPPVVGTSQTPLYAVLRDAVERNDPGAVAVPYMIPGYTDAKAWSRIGTHCYGFVPVRLPAGLAFNQLYHGDDERVPVEGMAWGLKVLGEVVERFCVRG